MKILFMGIGLVHYYNLILNRLNAIEPLEVINLIPSNSRGHVGDGVYQTHRGVSFRVRELPQFDLPPFYHSFRKLPSLLREERPDIIVVSNYYLYMFLFNLPLILTVRRLGARIILKSIPFGVKSYPQTLQEIRTSPPHLPEGLPRALAALLKPPFIHRSLRRVFLEIHRISYQIPHAHINYLEEAYDIYGSYGVPRDKIFITHNSPDTDFLFRVRAAIEKEPPVLPQSEHRLVHVGRLVPWKRTDLLIRALAAVKREFPDAELLVIGEGPEEGPLKSLAERLGLRSCVFFLGGVYDPYLLGKYLMASTAYVLAGMGGISINDAMVFGLPVICSVCDGTEKKLVREGVNGFYFKDGDETDLASRVLSLFRDPALVEEMGKNSTKIIKEDINIHTVLRGYLDAFQFVMKESTLPLGDMRGDGGQEWP